MHSPHGISHFLHAQFSRKGSNTNVLDPGDNPSILMSERRRCLPPEVGYAWNWYVETLLAAKTERRHVQLLEEFPRINCHFPNQPWTFESGFDHGWETEHRHNEPDLAPEEVIKDGHIMPSEAWVEQRGLETKTQVVCRTHPHREKMKHLFARACEVGRHRAQSEGRENSRGALPESKPASPPKSAPMRVDSGINGVR